MLGSLIEKSRTTPDYYPMTVNGLTAACNQTSNRDPVTTYSEEEILDALASLRGKDLTRSVRTARSRIMKHQHDLENALVLKVPATSLLAVLLLRGSQTVGELRTRTERYCEFTSLAAVEETLTALADEDPALVARLDRRPGQKEARWTQLITSETSGLDHPQPVATDPQESDLAARVSALETRVAELERELGV